MESYAFILDYEHQNWDTIWDTKKKKWLTDTCKPLSCGEGGIRTPGTFQFNSFQDCRNRPLYHLSFQNPGILSVGTANLDKKYDSANLFGTC